MPVESHEKHIFHDPPCDCHKLRYCPHDDPAMAYLFNLLEKNKQDSWRCPVEQIRGRGFFVHSADGTEFIEESSEEEAERQRSFDRNYEEFE